MDPILNQNTICALLPFSKRTDITAQMSKIFFRDKYTDSDFPANITSLLGKVMPQGYNGEWSGIAWRTPEDIFGYEGDFHYFGVMDPGNSVVGFLPDLYFLSAIAITLAHSSYAIQRLNILKEYNKDGLYGFWLCVDGAWKEVQVDDRLPVFIDEDNKIARLAFSSTSVTNDIWLPLLEKAYAKSMGSYYAIATGDPLYALNTLTGAPIERINDFSCLGELWGYLMDSYNKGYIMIAVFTGFKQSVHKSIIPRIAYLIEAMEVDTEGHKVIHVKDLLRIENNAVQEDVNQFDTMFIHEKESIKFEAFPNVFDMVIL